MTANIRGEGAVLDARYLKSIPGFTCDEDVIAAHAQDLTRWCQRAILDGVSWPANLSSRRSGLVAEAQEK